MPVDLSPPATFSLRAWWPPASYGPCFNSCHADLWRLPLCCRGPPFLLARRFIGQARLI